MKVTHFIIKTDTGEEHIINIPENYDVSMFNNFNTNGYFQIEGHTVIGDSIQTIMIHPNRISTSRIESVLQSAINQL